MSQSGSFHTGGGGGAGKVNVQDISFTKYIAFLFTIIQNDVALGMFMKPDASLSASWFSVI